MVKALLKVSPPNVDMVANLPQGTPLMCACMAYPATRGGSFAIIDVLLAAGAVATAEILQSCLHPAVIRRLIEAGVDPKTADEVEMMEDQTHAKCPLFNAAGASVFKPCCSVP